MHENGTAVTLENGFILGIISLILGDTIMKYLGVKCHDGKISI